MSFCTTDLPRCSKDTRLWYVVCGTYVHTFEGLQVHNNERKHCQQLFDLGLPNEHGDIDHNMDYSNVTFYVTMFSKNHFLIKYDDLLNGFGTLDYFQGKGITISMCVSKILNVRVNSRFSKEHIFDYNCATCIKNLSQIHDYVLLVENDIVTDIIVFDDILQ